MSDDARSSHEDEEDLSEGPGGAPPATFEFLVHTLFTQALMALGRIPNPITKQSVTNLATAKHFVGMLAMLEEKTRGNLGAEERQLVDQVLFELRMRFVEAKKNQSPIIQP